MKKFVAIGVLFVFLVNTMGYYVVFKCNQYLVKKEMVTQMRGGVFHPDIVLLKILHPEKEKQFRRVEKNEFSYQGKLYDIVVERKCGDTSIFYCLHDKKEEALLADFTVFLRRSGGSGTSSKDNPLPALLHNLISQALIQNPSLPEMGSGVTFVFPISQEPIIPVYLVHFAPPPEIV
ncbi:MAG: hypothetical protein ACOYNC_08595 [Bacteroidales bacterium]